MEPPTKRQVELLAGAERRSGTTSPYTFRDRFGRLCLRGEGEISRKDMTYIISCARAQAATNPR